VTEDSLKPPPAINFARVLEYAMLAQWETDTGGGTNPGEGEGLAAVAYLAIGQRAQGSGVSLFHCDRGWKVLGVAPCASLFEAEHLAERIYPGMSSYWTDAQVGEEDVAWYLYQIWGSEQCHFCGREAGEISRLIEKNGARICDSCVADCYQLLREDDSSMAPTAS